MGPLEQTLGFVGFGRMAEALARGAIGAGTVATERVVAYDPEPARRALASSLGARALESNRAVLETSSVIVLAVKPQTMAGVLVELKPYARLEHLFVSIAAGWRLERLEKALPAGTRVVRVMPNTPMQVGRGTSAVAKGSSATRADVELVLRLFSSCGEALEVDERDMDAVTAVSGSGPAYAFFLAECMIEAGVAEGLAHGIAMRLAASTLEGAGALLKASGEKPEELRRRVTSPGGTTEAAFKEIDAGRIREHLVRAIRQAAKRSRELASS